MLSGHLKSYLACQCHLPCISHLLYLTRHSGCLSSIVSPQVFFASSSQFQLNFKSLPLPLSSFLSIFLPSFLPSFFPLLLILLYIHLPPPPSLTLLSRPYLTNYPLSSRLLFCVQARTWLQPACLTASTICTPMRDWGNMS